MKKKMSITAKINLKKYILISREQTIAYDDEKCFLNDDVQQDGDKNPQQVAQKIQRDFYNSFFKKQYKHIVVLAGAGTSMDNGDKSSGETRVGLWDACQSEIDKFKGEIKNLEKLEFYRDKNIEDLLSYLILYRKLNKNGNENFSCLLKELEGVIVQKCRLTLEKATAPHKRFLDKITARKARFPRVQLFTTNYDTLFEQAANEGGLVVIDGFSFSYPRRFSGRYFDFDIVYRGRTRVKQEDNFVQKVLHLYKLHGSVTWEKRNNIIVQETSPKEPLIVYPASEKYESSYEQPYFEMMSRFQAVLREEDVLLIVVGFGFKDKHIQNVILEAVEQNPSFQLAVINYNTSSGGINSNDLSLLFDRRVVADGGAPSDIEEKSLGKQVKRNVSIFFDSFKSFTEKYPDNQSYREGEDEAVQS